MSITLLRLELEDISDAFIWLGYVCVLVFGLFWKGYECVGIWFILEGL
ncbi:hypothetical protein [Helicobacter sp. 13S00477-4]|nr:hypothetical protein [Helicobacter sp. 13S00477-4]